MNFNSKICVLNLQSFVYIITKKDPKKYLNFRKIKKVIYKFFEDMLIYEIYRNTTHLLATLPNIFVVPIKLLNFDFNPYKKDSSVFIL